MNLSSSYYYIKYIDLVFDFRSVEQLFMLQNSVWILLKIRSIGLYLHHNLMTDDRTASCSVVICNLLYYIINNTF